MGLSTNYDGFHGLDGSCNFHSCICTIVVSLGFRGSHVWYSMGYFPSKFTPIEGTWGIAANVAIGNQTLSTTYACEVVPTVLRPYVTAYVCMCWGAGILLSSGVVRAVAGLQGDLGWRLPFALQWVWPVPLIIGAYFAPESPWNSVRRNNMDEARESLMRLRQDTPGKDLEVEATLAYIRHTTALEQAETANASLWECFQGTNLRRTEIVSTRQFYLVLLQRYRIIWSNI
jgi:hypothetical protein